MTEKDYIQTLLNSYLAAETTEEEEQLLSDYFCSHRDIPNEWLGYSVLFRGMQRNHTSKTCSLPSNENTKKRWLLSPWQVGVAAMIAIVLGISFFMLQKEREAVPPKVIASAMENPAPKPPVEQHTKDKGKTETDCETSAKPLRRSRRLAKSLRKSNNKSDALPCKAIPVQATMSQDSASPSADEEIMDYTPSLMNHHRQMRDAMLAMLNE